MRGQGKSSGGLLQTAGRLRADERESLRHETNMKPAGNSTVVASIRSLCRILFYVRLPNSQRQIRPFDPSLLKRGRLSHKRRCHGNKTVMNKVSRPPASLGRLDVDNLPPAGTYARCWFPGMSVDDLKGCG